MLADLNSSLSCCGFTLTAAEEEMIAEMSVIHTTPEDHETITQRLNRSVKSFDIEQEAIFNDVSRALIGNKGKTVYVDSPGRSGKTFLLNALIDFSSLNLIAHLVVASSEVASLLLKGGRTAHLTFKIPIPCKSGAFCSI